MVCPECNGTGKDVQMSESGEHARVYVCSRCNGTGEIEMKDVGTIDMEGVVDNDGGEV